MQIAVIDANVFKAFFEVEVLRMPPPRPQRTDDAKPIFDSLGINVVVALDNGEQIENEWRNMCPGAEEWFNEWIGYAYANDLIYIIDVRPCAKLKKTFRSLGFPVTEKDFWYIKTCNSISTLCKKNDTLLITEDIDFYSPKDKANSKKQRFIRNSKGPIVQELLNLNTKVMCISTTRRELSI